MKNVLFRAGNDWTGLITRLAAGIILFPHGAQKLLGIFGGYGFSGTMQYFSSLHIPWIIGVIVILLESIGSLFLILGLGGRIWSALIVVLMLGILVLVHGEYGFFMNWFGNQKGEGYEFDLLMIGLALATLINGSGRYSLDRVLTQRVTA